MDGRRRQGAFGSTLTTLYTDDRKRRLEREEFDRRLQQALQLRQQGVNANVSQSGGMTLGRQPTSAAPRPVDPLIQANRVAGLQKNIQGIELKNQLAPILAQQEYNKQYPMASGDVAGKSPLLPALPMGGRFIDRQPSGVEGLLGIQQRPQFTPPTPTDTSYLHGQLNQAMGQTPQPQMGGVGGLMPQGNSMDGEVADLMAAVRSGTIRSRQQAMQVIQQAGLNPNDPAFQQVLNQLQ